MKIIVNKKLNPDGLRLVLLEQNRYKNHDGSPAVSKEDSDLFFTMLKTLYKNKIKIVINVASDNNPEVSSFAFMNNISEKGFDTMNYCSVSIENERQLIPEEYEMTGSISYKSLRFHYFYCVLYAMQVVIEQTGVLERITNRKYANEENMADAFSCFIENHSELSDVQIKEIKVKISEIKQIINTENFFLKSVIEKTIGKKVISFLDKTLMKDIVENIEIIND